MQLFGYSDSVHDSADASDKDGAASRCAAASATESRDADDGGGGRVFAARASRRVAAAAGRKRRQDVVIQIRRIDELDSYVTATRRGLIATWTSKVTIEHQARLRPRILPAGFWGPVWMAVMLNETHTLQ